MRGSTSKGGWSRPLFLLKFAASLGLLGYVVWTSGLNSAAARAELLNTLCRVNVFWFFFSILIGMLLTMTSSWKWRVLLRSKGIEVSFGRLLLFYFIGRFFNMFLPSSMGGDVVRIWELSRHAGEKYESLASVLVERLSGMTTLVFFAAVATLLHNYHLPFLTTGIFLLAAMNVVIFWLILDQRILPLLSRLMGGRLALADRLLDRLGRLQRAVRAYKDKPTALAKVFAISCLFYLLAVVNVWGAAMAFSPGVDFFSMFLAVPAIMLVMNLPVSIGGIGLTEAAFAFFFPLFGYSTALAISTALLMRFKSVLYGLAGGLLHLGRLRGNPKRAGNDGQIAP